MKYTVEDLSPVKKSIAITVPADEVDAAVNATVAGYAANIKMDGFRKGKAPLSTIERRYAQEIYSETMREMVNRNIGEIFEATKLEPLTGIEFDGGALERGKEYAYTVTFEVLPEFEIPAYEGVDVEKEKVAVADEDIDGMIERLRTNMAELKPVETPRKPVDGDSVTLDFEGSENGELLPEVKGEYFQMVVGDGSTIPDFDALVRTAMPDEEVTGKVTFPEEYMSKELSGKTIDMKIRIHSVMERILPPLDDEIAKRSGLESLEKMREVIAGSYSANRESLARSVAQKTLLDGLLAKSEFTLPERMVETYMDTMYENRKDSLQKQDDGKTPQEQREEFRTEAEEIARAQVFLLAVAKKENITVSDREVEALIHQMASRYNQDPKMLLDHYVQNNMIQTLRDRIMADKAMDFIYSKANIIEKEMPAENAEQPAPKKTTKKAKAEPKDEAEAQEKPAAKKPRATKKAKEADE